MRTEPLEYNVTKLPAATEIDGIWERPAWQSIEHLALAHHMGDAPVHRPHVEAKLLWDDDALTLIFRVADRYVRAVAENHQDPVYKDSCVEFFFTPGPDLGLSYFNLEINCGGTMLFWWHPKNEEAMPVAAEDCDRIEIAHSLPKMVEPEIKEPTTWTLEYRLPFDILRKYCPAATDPAPGVIWKANFYKCADESSHPHWLTWAPVDHPTPRFHMPGYFGALLFK